jgi:hypothetical protein
MFWWKSSPAPKQTPAPPKTKTHQTAAGLAVYKAEPAAVALARAPRPAQQRTVIACHAGPMSHFPPGVLASRSEGLPKAGGPGGGRSAKTNLAPIDTNH